MSQSKTQAESSHSRDRSGRTRAPNWTDTLDAIFVALMRQENDIGNCHNGTFPQETWKNITKCFNERTNLAFTYRNLKNRLKVLKKTFNLYYNLSNRSGWGWDPAINVPTCGDEQMWDEVISVNKDYARIKGKSFPVYEDIDLLFSKTTATGRRGDSSALPEGLSDNDTSDDEVDRTNLDDIDVSHPSNRSAGHSYSSSSHFDQQFDDVFQHSPSPCASTQPTDCSLDPASTTSSGKRKRTETVNTTARQSKSTGQSADAFLELVDQGKKRLEIANEILRREQLSRPTVYSIDECMRKLESIPGITPDCILAVGDCLKNEINRWFLMHYEGSMLEAWLKRQMTEFYRLPPSVGAPSASFSSGPNFFMSQMHGVNQEGPSVFVPPPMHASSRGGHFPFRQPFFRPSYDLSGSQGHSHSTTVSGQDSVSTSPASSSHDADFASDRCP